MSVAGPSAPIIVLNQNTKREQGHGVQLRNIASAETIGDVVRTCLGPKAMLKMLMDPMGGIVMTNDGNCILREITVEHPAAKSLIEIARSQDEEVGDGTTSVVILTAQMLSVALPFIRDKMHPTIIIQAYRQALEDIVHILDAKGTQPVAMDDDQRLRTVVQSCIGTKFMARWSDLVVDIAVTAVKRVTIEDEDAGRAGSVLSSKKDIDTKRYVKVEKIPGGVIEDSFVMNGVMFNKDVVHPRMARRIEKPRILLLDCNLEYKKGESQTNIEMTGETDFTKILQLEEEYIRRICGSIISHAPNLVITEKGVSDLAQHFLAKAGISVIRRLRKTDNLRVARACRATIVNRVEEISESDIGTGCGLFEVKKIGDEYFTYIDKCAEAKACSVVLRGASKDVLNEVERNLQDALHVARNVCLDARVAAGGGAVEMALSRALYERSKALDPMLQDPYRAVAAALEIIPRTLLQNCGQNTVRGMTALRAKHAVKADENDATRFGWGINGETGELCNMLTPQHQNGEASGSPQILEPVAVKMQVYKTAIETAILLLRIDDIVSGSKKRDQEQQE